MAGYTMTSKEQSVLTDVLNSEKLCMTKYQNYANQIQDPTLKQMFQQLATSGQQNIQTITQLFTQAGITPPTS